MRTNLRGSLFAAIAILGGVVVLLGYFVQLPLLVDLQVLFLRWAVILTSVLLLVGVLNLAQTHWRKVARQQSAGIYSLILLVSLFITIAALAIEKLGLFGASGWSAWLLEYITIPVEGSLVAVLAIILIFAAARLFGRQLSLFSMVLIVTTLFVMVGTASLPGIDLPVLRAVRDWLVYIPASAGARGILLGVGLGTIATGLRVLMGSDRPYGG
jgi:hypothetical protein